MFIPGKQETISSAYTSTNNNNEKYKTQGDLLLYDFLLLLYSFILRLDFLFAKNDLWMMGRKCKNKAENINKKQSYKKEIKYETLFMSHLFSIIYTHIYIQYYNGVISVVVKVSSRC